MTCTKNPIPEHKIKSTLRAAEERYGVPMFAYDCPRCGKIHLTTEEPGTHPNKRIL